MGQETGKAPKGCPRAQPPPAGALQGAAAAAAAGGPWLPLPSPAAACLRCPTPGAAGGGRGGGWYLLDFAQPLLVLGQLSHEGPVTEPALGRSLLQRLVAGPLASHQRLLLGHPAIQLHGAGAARQTQPAPSRRRRRARPPPLRRSPARGSRARSPARVAHPSAHPLPAAAAGRAPPPAPPPPNLPRRPPPPPPLPRARAESPAARLLPPLHARPRDWLGEGTGARPSGSRNPTGGGKGSRTPGCLPPSPLPPPGRRLTRRAGGRRSRSFSRAARLSLLPAIHLI